MTTSSTLHWSRMAAIAVACAAVVAPAAAQSQSPITVKAQPVQSPDTFRMLVSYHDLDLKTPDGRTTLEARVRTAAREGCNELYNNRPTTQTLGVRIACTRLSVAEAMPRIDHAVELADSGRGATQIALVFRR